MCSVSAHEKVSFIIGRGGTFLLLPAAHFNRACSLLGLSHNTAKEISPNALSLWVRTIKWHQRTNKICAAFLPSSALNKGRMFVLFLGRQERKWNKRGAVESLFSLSLSLRSLGPLDTNWQWRRSLSHSALFLLLSASAMYSLWSCAFIHTA